VHLTATTSFELRQCQDDAQLAPVTRVALCAVMFSLPLEVPDWLPFEVSTILGAVFLCTTMLQPRLAYGRLPWALLFFSSYLYVLLLAFAFHGTSYPPGLYGKEVTTLVLLMLLWLLVFWACSNLFRTERTVRAALWAFVIGCLVRAALPLLGLARTAHPEGTGGERVTAFGQNANQSAHVLALGLLTLIGLAYMRPRGARRRRTLIWAAAGLLVIGLVQTGSRGGLVVLVVGLTIFLMAGDTFRERLRNATAGLLTLGILFVVASRSQLMLSRLSKAQAGSLSQRERIFPLQVQMIREKPLTGWGPITNKYELGLRVGDSIHVRRDAHNIVLEMMTAAGLLGTIPFLVGIYLCFRSAWRARAGPWGILPLATVLAVLAGNMSEDRISGPLLWLVLAYALASGMAVPREQLADTSPTRSHAA
jgi:O-antigen ligase